MATEHNGTGAFWDDTYPADSEPMYKGALEMRDLRHGVEDRIAQEHIRPADSKAGGRHFPGSAIAYSQADEPTKRPDPDEDGFDGFGDTLAVFTSADYGRLWHDTDTDVVYVLTADTPTWTKVGGFTDRGDPVALDYDETDLTVNASWTDLDLGADVSVPAGATAVLLRVFVEDAALGSYLSFRKKGNSSAISVSTVVVIVTANVVYADIIVPCDADQEIQYYRYTADGLAVTAAGVVVKGWWK